MFFSGTSFQGAPLPAFAPLERFHVINFSIGPEKRSGRLLVAPVESRARHSEKTHPRGDAEDGQHLPLVGVAALCARGGERGASQSP